ncbi:MAG TPA: cytochrome c oxidase subunit II [Actinomycetota bacterium]|nr:cytochrome c oxidase subunit II [Actinomycetota bacterium]
MKGPAVVAGVLWLGLTALGEVALWRPRFFPGRYAAEAQLVDSAFLLLARLAVPVFAFVLSVLVVAVARFRHRRGPRQDGPPLRGDPVVYSLWLSLTTALALLVILNPGLLGLQELQQPVGERDELVVRAEASRWSWAVTYPNGVTTRDELVLPAGRRVRFEVTSTDILHSFWIPAFRLKVDAVPGMTTVVHATPTRVGSSDHDPALRVQCAELCGLGHSMMSMRVRVVDQETFEAWLRGTTPGPAACAPARAELRITAERIAFDRSCLAVPADTPVTLTLDNRDQGIPHNLSVARDEGFTDVVFSGEIFSGPGSRTYRLGPLPAGTYFFRCDVHPVPAMSGTFIVEEG